LESVIDESSVGGETNRADVCVADDQ
jgi:hypothetical protein